MNVPIMKEASSNRQFSCRKSYNIERFHSESLQKIHNRRIWNTLQKGKQIHLTCLLSWRPHWFSSLQFAILRQNAMNQHQASHLTLPTSFRSTEQGMAFTSQPQLFKLAHPSVWILAPYPTKQTKSFESSLFFFLFFILPSFWFFEIFFSSFLSFSFFKIRCAYQWVSNSGSCSPPKQQLVALILLIYLFLFFGLYPFLYLQALITIAETLTLSTSSPTCCCYKKIPRKHQKKEHKEIMICIN